MIKYISIGYTKKNHGVKGALRAVVESDFIADLNVAGVVFLEIKGQKVPYFIERIQETQGLILKLEEIDSRETALRLSNKEIFLREQDIQQKPEQEEVPEGLMHLVGFFLEEVEKGKIGKIEEVIEMPQQIMAVVKYQEREIFIPLNESFIKEIDAKEKVIKVELPEGLLDL